MPKKFHGENTKSVVARARKEAVKQAQLEKKLQEEEDALWKDDNKHVVRKQQRKEEKDKKKMESAERKALSKQLLDDEMKSIKPAKIQPPTKLTRSQILLSQAKMSEETKKRSQEEQEEEMPLEENINRLMVDGLEARNIDEAIAVLSVHDESNVDHHPEKRMKAAYLQFEENQLPRLKAENPNLRLSQLKQMLKKDWMKSPDNPLNQARAAFNSSH